MRCRFPIIAAAAVAVSVALAGAADAAIVVTAHGAGGARPGMREAAVERALGVPLRIDYLDPSHACGTAGFDIGRTRGYAMFSADRLVSLWFERGATTGRGIHIGSTVAELRAAYPKLRSRPDRYVPGATNIFYRRPVAPHWRLRFDVSPSGRVTRISFGNESVFLVEGCA
jgi:hypothetical protein